jgi:tetratricopeptide (TPR) repeat protein
LVRLGELGWTTSHDTVNEAVVANLDAPSLAQRHAQLAAALRREGRDPAETARHWLAAGDRTKATDAYAAAAQRALDTFADAEAVAAAEAGLALEPDDAGLLEVRAQARARRGDIAGARADLRSALARHPAGPARARLLGRLAILASGADDMIRAAELAESAVVAAGDDEPAVASALETAAIIDMNLGRAQRAQERSATALDLYRRLADSRGMARVLDARAMATFLDGKVREGQRALNRAADLFEDSGDLMRVVTPRSTSGHAAVFAGDADEGLRLTTAALELARTLGHPEGQAYALWHRAEALAALDRSQEAMQEARSALAVATALGHRGWTATSWRAIGIAAQVAGDLDQASAAFEQSLLASEHLDLFASWAASRAAVVLVRLGEIERATNLVTRARAIGPALSRYEALLAQVMLANARGDADTSDLARRAITVFERGGVRQGLDQLTVVAG